MRGLSPFGLCYGPPGVGKTLSARHYAKWDLLEEVFRRRFLEDYTVPTELKDCRCLYYVAPVVKTPSRIEGDLHKIRVDLSNAVGDATAAYEGREKRSMYENDPTELMIVDEADRLKLAGLELLRDIYDREQIGLILIGMPGLEKRLSRYPQLYSRVGFAHEFKPLSQEEVRFILERKCDELGLPFHPDDFTDAEAVTALIRITGGNFRLIHRMFAQIERILEINELKTITKEVVEVARQSLVIGHI